MQTIVLDTAQANSAVGNFIQQVGAGGAEVRNADGRIIAYLLPPENIEAYLYAEAHREADVHKDRIRAASARRGGKTTEQMLALLNALPLKSTAPAQ